MNAAIQNVCRVAALSLLCLPLRAQAGDWPFYRHDLSGTANAGEVLTTEQAKALEVKRYLLLGADNFSNPIVVGKNLFYTGGDGFLHAVDLDSFSERWRKKMLAKGPLLTTVPGCPGMGSMPPVGAPAVVGSNVFVPGGDGIVYSLDSQTGTSNWTTTVADVKTLGEFFWSSAFPLNGKIYVGVSSLHDCLLVPGRLVALDQATGTVTGTWWADANHGPGGGIWTQPAYDPVSKKIFVTTGTIAKGKTPATQPYADAFVAIDPATMKTLDYWSGIPNDSFSADLDFGASPTLYDAPAPDGRHFIAATDKNGYVYALNRDDLAKGPIWSYKISDPGASPDFGESSIVSAPYADGALYVAGGQIRVGSITYPGAVAAVDAFTGVEKWLFHPDGFVLPGMTVAGDVLFVGVTDPTTKRGILYALDRSTGAVLYQLATARIFGEPTWANGALYVGDGTGLMLELVPNALGPQPDFDLTVDRLLGEVVAGSTVNFTAKAIPKNGFTDTVTVTATRLPSLSSATLTPSALSATPPPGLNPWESTFAIATSNTTSLYELAVITGSGGGRTRSTAMWVEISDFKLSATAAQTVQGASAASTVTIAKNNGFSNPVTLAVTGLPAGTTYSFNLNPATAQSTLTFVTSASTPPGSYLVQVTGTSGTLTRNCQVALTVLLPADFALAATAAAAAQGSTAASTVTIAPSGGFNSPVTLSVDGLPAGITASFDSNPATAAATLTFSTSVTAATGSYAVQLTGTSGSLVRHTTVTLTVRLRPDFAVTVQNPAQTILAGTKAVYQVMVASVGDFSAPIAVALSGLPPRATGSVSPGTAFNVQEVTVAVPGDAASGDWTFSIVVTGGGLTRTASASLTVLPTPDFVLTAGSSAKLSPGGTASIPVAIAMRNGFSDKVTLEIQGLPAGVTGTLAPLDKANAATLSLTASAAAVPGTYAATIVATGGGLSRAATVSIEVAQKSAQAGGCATGGSAGFSSAILALLMMARWRRRRSPHG